MSVVLWRRMRSIRRLSESMHASISSMSLYTAILTFVPTVASQMMDWLPKDFESNQS
jgi:hypothetical protein